MGFTSHLKLAYFIILKSIKQLRDWFYIKKKENSAFFEQPVQSQILFSILRET